MHIGFTEPVHWSFLQLDRRRDTCGIHPCQNGNGKEDTVNSAVGYAKSRPTQIAAVMRSKKRK